jgi:hypothetical protein
MAIINAGGIETYYSLEGAAGGGAACFVIVTWFWGLTCDFAGIDGKTDPRRCLKVFFPTLRKNAKDGAPVHPSDTSRREFVPIVPLVQSFVAKLELMLVVHVAAAG